MQQLDDTVIDVHCTTEWPKTPGTIGKRKKNEEAGVKWKSEDEKMTYTH